MSGLWNYASACSNLLEELRSSLTKEEVASLRAECAEMGHKKWVQWSYQDHIRPEVRAYAAATPSQRKSKKKWQDQQLKRHLVLAAHQHIAQGRQLLRTLCECPMEPGGSYRDMALIAGDAYERILYDDSFEEWPFDGKNPFE